MIGLVSAAPGVEPEHHVEPEQRVTPLELFFDLVFVFGLTQVTALMSENPSWEGLGQGILVLAALWWAWGAYAWLTNTIDAEEDMARLAMFVSMAAMLVAALAVPDAFGDDGVLFGCAYFVVRIMHIVVYAEATDDVGVHQAAMRLARTAIPGPALLIIAGFLDGPAQAGLWIVALTIDFGGPYVFGVRGFTVSPAHFAERFELVVIIALGESIVAIGAGIGGLELDAGLVTAAVLGITIAAALWWAYFDVVTLVAKRHFREARGHAQVRMARDSYSYIHLPIVAGIVLVALGVKKTLADVEEPLATVPAVALFGGLALYLLGHIAFRLRNVHTLNRQRLVTAIVLLALIPLATEIDALAALAVSVGLCASLVAYEAIRFSEARARVRTAAR
jgi:low temperature requirement protein LtrA